jgi:hypothetical protein
MEYEIQVGNTTLSIEAITARVAATEVLMMVPAAEQVIAKFMLNGKQINIPFFRKDMIEIK